MSYRKLLLQVVALTITALLLVACGAPPQPPHPVGEPVDVGGWHAAQTWMVKYALQIDPKEKQASGWRVSVKNAGPRDLALTGSGGQFYCVLLALGNTTADPGALDLTAGSPMLIDPHGAKYPVKGMRLGSELFVLPDRQSGSISSATQCSFSAPDAEGRQKADCESMLSAESNGKTFDRALVAVGASKTVDLEIAFEVPASVSGWVLEWPDGVRFALP